MKKLLSVIALFIAASSFAASEVYRYTEYTPGTNKVVTIVGEKNREMVPVMIMQEITGTTTNTATVTFTPYQTGDSGSTYRLAPLTAVVGGAEVPQPLNLGSNYVYPNALLYQDEWVITGSAGTAYSNVVYTVLWKIKTIQ